MKVKAQVTFKLDAFVSTGIEASGIDVEFCEIELADHNTLVLRYDDDDDGVSENLSSGMGYLEVSDDFAYRVNQLGGFLEACKVTAISKNKIEVIYDFPFVSSEDTQTISITISEVLEVTDDILEDLYARDLTLSDLNLEVDLYGKIYFD